MSTTRFIETEHDRKTLLRFLELHELPFVTSMVTGGKRTLKQNRLQRKWINEIAEQLGDQTPEEIRGFCKLTFGVPVLREQNEVFREAYDKHVKSLPFEQKMALMMEPFDFAVTRLMTTKQHTSYLDAMHRHFSGLGIELTDPGDLLNQADTAYMAEKGIA